MKTVCKCLLLAALFLITAGVASSQGKKGAGAAASPASSASPAPTASSGSSAAIESQMLAFGGLDE